MSTQPMSSNASRASNDGNEPTPFYEALAKALKKRKAKLESICPSSEPVSKRILEEYGAIFVADNGRGITGFHQLDVQEQAPRSAVSIHKWMDLDEPRM